MTEDVSKLELIRHDTAHVMAMAVQELFPGTQVTIGPTIETVSYTHLTLPTKRIV